MRFRLLVAVLAVAGACASDDAFDRANDDFAVSVGGAELTVETSLGVGFHPTEAEAVIQAEGVVGPLLVCPVDGVGALMPDVDVGVPPCNAVTEVAELAATDGGVHVVVGFRALGPAAVESVTLRYLQADGYLALFYAGEPQTVTIEGPAEGRPLVTNFGGVTARVNGVAIGPGEAVEIPESKLVVDLGEEASLDIDWFGERVQAEDG